jgi:Ca2+-binding RTX toxin-like protein/uncharacterized protein YegL
LSINLSNAVNASIADGAGVGTIRDNDPVPTLPPSATTVTVDDSHLAGGSHVTAGGLSEAATASNSFTLHPDEAALLTVSGADGQPVAVTNGLVVQGNHGYITFQVSGGTVSYTYTLTGAYAHVPNTGADQLAAGADQFALALAGSSLGAISAGIEDDAPVLALLTPSSVNLDDANDFSASGALSFAGGADGLAGGADSVAVTVNHTYTHEGTSTSGGQTVQVPLDGTRVTVDTVAGAMELYMQDGQIKYSYQADYGFTGDTEAIVLSVVDTDGDAASQTLTVNLQDNVPSTVFNLDEAGLSFGSQAPGHGDASSFLSLSGASLQSDATGIAWDMGTLPSLKADGNLDGTYSNVTWQQSGNTLRGYAEGKLVLTVEPEFENGIFTGNLSTTLYRPLEHGAPGSDTDDTLSFDLVFKQTKPGSPGLDSVIRINIQDDDPGRADEGANRTLEIMEGGQARADVYLVLDTSGSLDSTEMGQQVAAIRMMAQRYIDNGVDAMFTIATFGTDSGMILDHVTPQQVLASITSASSIDMIRGLTHYSTVLDRMKVNMEAWLNDAETADIPHTLYFVTDGEPTTNYWTAAQQTAWQNYLNAHSNLDVYALGVGVGSGSGPQNALKAVAGGDASHVINISNYSTLGDTLQGMVPFESSNIFEVMGSADVAEIISVTINGVVHAMLATVDSVTGLHHTGGITLPNGSVIDFFENGDYVLKANDVTADFNVTVNFNLRDADGDTHSTGDITMTIKDHVPTAYDDISYMTGGVSHTPGQVLGTFATPNNDYSDHEGWISTTDVSWSCTGTTDFPPAARPGAWSGAIADRVQAEYGLNLNSGSYANGNYAVRLIAEARTPQQVSLIADWDTMMDFVQSHGNKVVAYTGNNPDITVIANTVVSRGGEIAISWGHFGRARTDGSERDGAFALLLDEDGTIVGSAFYQKTLPTSGTYTDSTQTGFWTITVPDSGFERTYKLVIAAFDGGDGTRNSTEDSKLYVDTVVQLNHDFSGPSHSGNLIKDRGVDGLPDEGWDEAKVGGIIVDGVPYNFATQSVVTVPTAEGTLYVGSNGEYFFKPSAPDGTFSGLDFQYVLIDRDGDTSDWTTVRLSAFGETPTPLAYDDVAQTDAAGTRLTGNVLRDAGPDGGSVDLVSESAFLTGFIYAGITHNFGAQSALDVSTTDGGTLHVETNGSYSYTPAAGQDLAGMADQFEYIVSDGGKTDTATAYLFSDDLRLSGTGGSDNLDHSAGFRAELIEAGAGNDTIAAGSGDDVLFGGAGNDTIYGGAGDDTLYGGTGNDVLYGEAGNDVLYGGAGNDTLYGEAGNDTIYGGAGDDVIYGGGGNDILLGGGGSDIFAWSSADLGLGGTDTIRDFSLGEDRLRFDNLFGNPDTITADDILAKLGSNELSIQANAGKLDVTVGSGTVIEIQSGGGAFDASVLTMANGSDADKAQLLLQLLTLNG